MNTHSKQNASHDYFDLDIRVVKQEEANNSTPNFTSIFACTPGCLTHNTCQTCTCAQGCISDIIHCGTAFTC